MDKPGFVNGRHYTQYVEEVRRLKRSGDLDDAEALLGRLIDATEAEARAERWSIAPWYYEQLAIVYEKRKAFQSAIDVLERYERQSSMGGGAKRFAGRLVRLRAKLGRGDA